MPSSPRIHYITPSGGPPNGGVPPGVVFSASQPPPGFVAPRPDMTWALYAATMQPPGAPPPYQAVPDTSSSPPAYHGIPAGLPVMCGSFPANYFPIPCLTPPPTLSSGAADHFKVPGSSLNGVIPDLDGYGYIFPPEDEHTTINFVDPPMRPCDKPNQEFGWSRHKAPTTLTVKQLIEQLGGIGDADGVTEIYELGDGKWAKGMTYKKDGAHKDKKLEEIGWTKRRGGEAAPVFLCAKKG